MLVLSSTLSISELLPNSSKERNVVMTATTSVKQAAFPKVCFWDRSAPLISLVNSGDFKRNDLLDRLGISGMPLEASFGTKDHDEILRRQRSVKFLVEHPDLRKFLREVQIEQCSQLPIDGQAFLDSFWVDPKIGHNRFFGMIQRFLDQLGPFEQLPAELAEFIYFLADTTTGAETLENSLAREMGEEIQKAAVLQGIAWIQVKAGSCKSSNDWVLTSSETYGYQKYSYHLSGLCESAERPYWMRRRIWRWLGVSKFVEMFLRRRDEKRCHRRFADLLIVDTPEEIEHAIWDFAREKLETGIEDVSSFDDVHLKFHFCYESGELKLRLVQYYSCLSSDRRRYDDKKWKKHEEDMRRFTPVISGDYPGYSKRQLDQIAKQNEELARAAAESQRQLDFSMKFFDFVESNAPMLLTSGVVATTPDLERRFKWNTIKGLRQNSQFSERCEKAAQYRNFVTSRIGELREISRVVDRLILRSQEWGLPLCFPTILSSSEHVVSFDQLLPVHLIGRKTENGEIKPNGLIPISQLASLNGRMIGLTGQNAGGKTVTKEAIVSAIFLAQSGLPVFGANVALNVKSTLGLVFLERGQGSTLELMLRKTGNVLRAVEQSPENDIVVFLDEVGTGTQEADGLGLGEKILTKLGRSGCSIVFSTQITALAKKAQDEMNALCYQIDLGHHIRPGIGGGGAELLAKQLGVAQLL